MRLSRAHGCRRLCIDKYQGIKCGRYHRMKPNSIADVPGADIMRGSLYLEGYRYCSRCTYFMNKWTENSHCLCCGRKMRIKPANTKQHREMNAIQVARY